MKIKQPSPSTVEQEIGSRIQALRELRGVTLDQLSLLTSLTKGQLSKVENGKVSSPVSTLTRIASALQVMPGQLFFDGNAPSQAILVKAGDRKVIAGRGSKLGHTYESLAYGLPAAKDFEPYLMTITEKKIDPKKNNFRHPGQELLFMLSGEMTYQHGGHPYELKTGDSLFFEGEVAHGPIRVSGLPVRFLSIISNRTKR
jgi:transcriptional regulator with XRE-family HTH domain